jgi:uncharacterized protein YeaO (DUF488 family)
MDVRLKRAYEPPAPADGYRVLIERVWSLRQWFGHEPSRFDDFRRRYIEELRGERPRLAGLRRRARQGTLTLVSSAQDAEHNDAVVLAEVLRRGLPKARA